MPILASFLLAARSMAGALTFTATGQLRPAALHVVFQSPELEPELWLVDLVDDLAAGLPPDEAALTGYQYWGISSADPESCFEFVGTEVAPDLVLELRPVPRGAWGRLWSRSPVRFTWTLATCPDREVIASGSADRAHLRRLWSGIEWPALRGSPRPSPWFDASVAVLPFANETNSLVGVEQLREVVRANVARKGYRVLDPDVVDERLRSIGITDGGQLRVVDAAVLRKALGAGHLVYGNVKEFRTDYVGRKGSRWQVELALRWEHASATGRNRWWEMLSEVSTQEGGSAVIPYIVMTGVAKATRTYLKEESIEAVDRALLGLPARPRAVPAVRQPRTDYSETGVGPSMPIGNTRPFPGTSLAKAARAADEYRPGFGIHILGGREVGAGWMHEVEIGFSTHALTAEGVRLVGYRRVDGSLAPVSENTLALSYALGRRLLRGRFPLRPYAALAVRGTRSALYAEDLETVVGRRYTSNVNEPVPVTTREIDRRLASAWGIETAGLLGFDLDLVELQNHEMRLRVTWTYPLAGSGSFAPRAMAINAGLRFDFVTL